MSRVGDEVQTDGERANNSRPIYFLYCQFVLFAEPPDAQLILYPDSGHGMLFNMQSSLSGTRVAKEKASPHQLAFLILWIGAEEGT
jgi:hypothetical protein